MARQRNKKSAQELTVPASTPKPARFVSPGLSKVINRLNLVNREEFARVSRLGTNCKALAALASAGLIDELSALQRIANDLSLEYIPPEECQCARDPDVSISNLVSTKFALEQRCFPLRREGDSFVFALADPLDLETISRIEFTVDNPVKVVLAAEAAIVEAITSELEESDEHVVNFDELVDVGSANVSVEVILSEPAGSANGENGVEAPPIVRLVNKILADAAMQGASDVHIEPTTSALEIRFRVDGIMRHHLSIPKRLQPFVISRIKLLSDMDITERRRPQDGRFRMRTDRRTARDVRVSAVPTSFGENLVLRLLQPDAEGLTLASVGIPDEIQDSLEDALAGTDQLIVVTGPTGSGKTTTLYAAMSHVNTGANTLVTVEDPIEFRIPASTQIEVDAKVGVTFADGLRSILRQDPDVILVGEVRDLETAEIAFQAAQTGHLVLTTLHTNDAPSAVTRLLDLGLEPFIIAGSLRAVVAQRLVRKVCKNCACELEEAQKETIAETYHIDPSRMMAGAGCEDCGGSGYRGRTGIFSFLSVNQSIRELIRDGASTDEIAELGVQHGMKTLYQAGLELVCNGETTIAELERVVGRDHSFEEGLEAQSHAGSDKTPLDATNSDLNSQYRAQDVVVDLSPTMPDENTGGGSIASLAADFEEEEEESRHVLLVDDDRGVRAVMSKALRRAKFDVVEAKDGVEALEKIREQVPALVVCDLDMPGMNGREVLEAIRNDASTKNVPVLMLTGMDSEESEMALISAGASDFVSKSSSPALVVTRVKRLLA